MIPFHGAHRVRGVASGDATFSRIFDGFSFLACASSGKNRGWVLWFRWPIGLWPGSGSRRTAAKALLCQDRRIVSHCEQNSKFIPNITSPLPKLLFHL